MSALAGCGAKARHVDIASAFAVDTSRPEPPHAADSAASRLAEFRVPDASDPFVSACRTLADGLRELVNQALGTLYAKYRDVLLAFACAPDGEITNAQVAAEEGASAAAIRERWQRALASLEAQVRRWGVEKLLFVTPETYLPVREKIRTENNLSCSTARLAIAPRAVLRSHCGDGRRRHCCTSIESPRMLRRIKTANRIMDSIRASRCVATALIAIQQETELARCDRKRTGDQL